MLEQHVVASTNNTTTCVMCLRKERTSALKYANPIVKAGTNCGFQERVSPGSGASHARRLMVV